jgi:hypothetical protein
MMVRGQRHASAAFPPGKNAGTCCKGGWLGPSAILDGCGKETVSCPHRDSNPELSIPQQVTTPNTLFWLPPHVRWESYLFCAGQVEIGRHSFYPRKYEAGEWSALSPRKKAHDECKNRRLCGSWSRSGRYEEI